MRNTMYHVTKRENLASILETGLLPSKGENALLAGDATGNAVYLTERKHVAQWLILTGSDAVVSVDMEAAGVHAEEYSYGTCSEAWTHGPIPACAVSLSKKPGKNAMGHAMQKLAVSYLGEISRLCFQATRLEWQMTHAKETGIPERDWTEPLSKTAEAVTNGLRILGRIDFSAATNKDMAEQMRFLSNEACMVTFADGYLNPDFNPETPDAGKRCWEHLANIGVDGLKGPCRDLHAFIKRNIPYYVRKLPGLGSFCM